MYSLRCTQRLLRHLPFVASASTPRTSTRLGDWYANALFVGSARLVLCTSELSLLSVIVPLKDAQRLPLRLRAAVGSLLVRLGIHEAAVTTELRAMDDIVVARTASPRVLGSMTEIAWHCRDMAADSGRLDLRAWETYLADMPMLSQDPCEPGIKAAALLGAT
jgi:hypothetical protein